MESFDYHATGTILNHHDDVRGARIDGRHSPHALLLGEAVAIIEVACNVFFVKGAMRYFFHRSCMKTISRWRIQHLHIDFLCIRVRAKWAHSVFNHRLCKA